MSVQAIAAVLDYSQATKGARLTAISLANHADKHGVTWPSVRLAGEEALLKRRAVQEAIKVLRAKGELVLLVEAEGKTHRPPLYWLRLPGLRGTFASEGAADRYFKAFGEGLREGAAAVLSSFDPGAESAPGGGAGFDPGGVRNTTSAPYKGTVNKPKGAGERAVNRQLVTDDEYGLAEAIVTEFNATFGTKLSVDPHLTPIVGRIREKPELTAAHHRKIIAAVFDGDHWWSGPPGPRIIYGNAAQFEQSIELARAAQKAKRSTGDSALAQIVARKA